jgi:hypothetical protein
MIANGFQDFLLLFQGRKVKNKFSACFFEITYGISSKIRPETLIKELVAAYRKQAMTLEIVLKAACDSEKCCESRF